MPNPVTWFEIGGKDGKQLQQFYADLFSWKVDANNPMQYGMVDTQTGKGTNGGIYHSDAGPYLTIFVEVDDLQAYLDKAVKMGAKIIQPVTVVPDMVTWASFADLAGNVVGLIKSQNPS